MQTVAFFMDPVRHEFGWSQTTFMLGASAFGATVIPFSPIAGGIQDWLGPRRVAIAGAALCMVAMSSLGLTTGWVALWLAQWAFFSLSEMLIKPTVWLSVIGAVFERGRGLATAVSLSGTFGATILAPLACYELIARFGWRSAYAAMGLGWGGFTLLLVLLFFRRPSDAPGAAASSCAAMAPEAGAIVLTGLTVPQALRSVTLYRIAVALMLSTLMSTAVITHRVTILSELGISRGTAALIASVSGGAAVLGSLGIGWLYDKSRSTWIGVFSLGGSVFGYIPLLFHVQSTGLIVLAMLLFGISSGATLQATMYLTGQYCGQRNFGKIFGVKASLTAAGIALGPLLASALHDRFLSYHSLFIVGIVVSVACGMLMFGLGPYPNWTNPPKTALRVAIPPTAIVR
jgi:MFS family permease